MMSTKLHRSLCFGAILMHRLRNPYLGPSGPKRPPTSLAWGPKFSAKISFQKSKEIDPRNLNGDKSTIRPLFKPRPIFRNNGEQTGINQAIPFFQQKSRVCVQRFLWKVRGIHVKPRHRCASRYRTQEWRLTNYAKRTNL